MSTLTVTPSEHVCGLQGFGNELTDICPACQEESARYQARLTGEYVGTHIAGKVPKLVSASFPSSPTGSVPSLTEADVRRIVAEMRPAIEQQRITNLRRALNQIESYTSSGEECADIARLAMDRDDKLARGES